MAIGLMNTAHLPNDLARKSFAGMITRLMPNGQAPLVGLSALLKDEAVVNIEHGYFSKRMVFPSMVHEASTAGAGNTTLNVVAVDASTVPGDMYRVLETNENIVLNTIASGTQITVSRGVGTVAAATIPAGATFVHVGNAFEQASLRPNSVRIDTDRYVNYTQIFRNSWTNSRTLAAIPMIAGADQVSENKQDCAMFHAVAMEKALFFGQKFMGTRNGQPFHTMEGIIGRVQAAAPSNIVTLGSTTNYTQLQDALEPCLAVQTDPSGGNSRTCFVGSAARNVLHAIARLNSQYQIVASETMWGLQFDTFRTPRGVFEIVEHPLFNAYGPTSPWARMMVVCDLKAFATGYLRRTLDEEYNDKGTPVDNGIDARGGTLTTEMTCVMKNPEAFSVIYNFTAGAAG